MSITAKGIICSGGKECTQIVTSLVFSDEQHGENQVSCNSHAQTVCENRVK